MTYVPNPQYVAQGVLASDVANSGTFTVSYPTGSSQASFSAGLAATNHVLIVNGNDRYTVADSKISVSFGASDITVTNSTGATLAAGSKYVLGFDQVDGNGAVMLAFPVNLAAITGAGDVVTDFQPGVNGTIEGFSFTVTQPVTTAAKAATLNIEVGTTDLTGGVLALTSAAATPLGKVIQATAITAGASITKASKISIEAASVTAFSEGQGVLHIRVRPTPL